MLNPGQIRLGPGRVYVGVTNPGTGTPLVLSAGAPSTGTEVGLTEGEALWTFTVTYTEEVADQILAAVAVFAKTEKLSLEFTMKEYVAANLQIALQQGALVTNNATTPKTDMFELGGGAADLAVTLRSVCIVSPIPNTSPQRYTFGLIYQAYQESAVPVGFTKDKATVMKVKLSGIADTTRNDPDMLGQLVAERNT